MVCRVPIPPFPSFGLSSSSSSTSLSVSEISWSTGAWVVLLLEYVRRGGPTGWLLVIRGLPVELLGDDENMGEYLLYRTIWLALGPYVSCFWTTFEESAWETCGLDRPATGDRSKKKWEMRKDSQSTRTSDPPPHSGKRTPLGRSSCTTLRTLSRKRSIYPWHPVITAIHTIVQTSLVYITSQIPKIILLVIIRQIDVCSWFLGCCSSSSRRCGLGRRGIVLGITTCQLFSLLLTSADSRSLIEI